MGDNRGWGWGFGIGLCERAGSDGLVFVQFADCRLYGLGYGVMGDNDAETGVLFEYHSRSVWVLTAIS